MDDFKQTCVSIGMTVCGLIMLLTPLALWAAPTKTTFYYVLAFCGTAMFGVITLAQYEEPAAVRRRRRAKPKSRILTDDVINEMQKLWPFVHHHQGFGGRMFGKPNFRRRMNNIKRMLGWW